VAKGPLRGGSFGFAVRGTRWRWYTHERPVRRELRCARVSEVTLAVTYSPAWKQTWSGRLSPAFEAKFAALDDRRRRLARVRERSSPAADLVIPGEILPASSRRLIGDVAARQMRDEFRRVDAAARAHPTATVVDVYYPSRLHDLEARQRAHAVRLAT